MQCDRCKGQAVLSQKYSGKHLCRRHFIADVEARAKKSIRSYQWVRPRDHIGVALSGRAGSGALLYFLKYLAGNRRDIRITAITVTEGNMISADPSRAKEIAGSLGTEWIFGSFECTPLTIDTAEDLPSSGFFPCSYSHILLRCLLRTVAREKGITRIALGTTLDDRASSVLMMILSGKGERLFNLECNENEGTVPVIEPFMMVPASEVNLYAMLQGLGSGSRGCPPVRDSLHEDVVSMLNRYTEKHPATKYALMNLGRAIRSAAAPAHVPLPACRQCADLCQQISGSCRLPEGGVPYAP